MSRYYGRWVTYVPVAERRKQALREIAKRRKNGKLMSPVMIEGRVIATTFWGKSWCENLEAYHDLENRLPRGRAYVRNGSVIDLQIAPLEVKALVIGSSSYRVWIGVGAVPKAEWRSICRDCVGGIDSLVELLQGRFSKGVMDRLCRQNKGLFPKPSEIRFSCSCPDYAMMCKHVAAVLYGIGSRLDVQPELLFRLRAVDEADLVANLDATLPLANLKPTTENILETDDMSGLFGLDMVGDDGLADPASDVPVTPIPARRGKRSATSPKPKIRVPGPVKRPGKPKRASKPDVAAKPAKPRSSRLQSKKARSNSGSKGSNASARSGTSKFTYELTPDGYVKWWK